MRVAEFRLWLMLLLIVLTRQQACPTGADLIPNCATCTTSGTQTVCATCLNGYYLLNNGCVACSASLPNCQFCSTNTANQPTCDLCQTDYGLLNSQCKNCSAISGCQSCEIVQNSLQCQTCSSGLVLYNLRTQCVPCQISQCSSCTAEADNTFTCSQCNFGYYLTNNACEQCSSSIDYCSSCQFDQNTRLICTACSSSLLYLANNTCLANCTQGNLPLCATCTLVSLASGTMSCTTCIDGYFLNNAARVCQECSGVQQGCVSCTAVAGNDEAVLCATCATGYYLSQNPTFCVQCGAVQVNCAECNYNFSASQGQCTACVAGYYFNTSSTTCIQCASSSAGTATFQPGTCSRCQLSGSQLTCLQCKAGYYLEGTACTSCTTQVPFCSQCSTNSSFVCSGCQTGYLLNSAGQCDHCNATYPNCVACNSVQCTDCQAGYYTLDNRNCQADCLVTNCLTCVAQNNQQCQQCSNAYQLTSNGQCAIPSCASPLAFNGQQCVCPLLTYHQTTNNLCLSCPNNCQLCPNNVCQQCLPGFYLSNDICESCPSSCQSCTQTGQCLACIDHFVFNGSNCVAAGTRFVEQIGVESVLGLYRLCGRGCLVCASSTCSACSYGFYPSSGSCLPCPSNCKTCHVVTTTTNTTTDNTTNTTTTNTVTCLTCYPSFALLSSSCSACSSNLCVRCDYNVNFCLLCIVGYTPDGAGQCQACASDCAFCGEGGPGTCDSNSCGVGYARFNTSVCLKCLNGCSSCEATPPYACIGCRVGTYLADSSAQTCVNCPDGCSACSDATTCTACYPLYRLSNSACIAECRLPCLECSFTNGTQVCSSCLLSYTLTASGSCQVDFSCIATASCEVCPLEYFAYRGNCHRCVTNCLSCTFDPNDPGYTIGSGTAYREFVTCSLCKHGYYLDSSLTCQTCPSNCQLCHSLGHCYQCNQGYFLQTKLLNPSGLTYNVGKCVSCIQYCLSCQDLPQKCVSCKTGYTLSNFVCVSQNSVNFGLTLTSSDPDPYSTALNQYPTIFTAIASALGSSIQNNPYLLRIISIANGSVVVSGSAGIDPSQNPSDAYEQMNNALSGTSQVAGINVASTSVSAQGFSPNTQTEESSNNSLIFIIIGCSVLALILLVILIIICYRRRKSKQEETSSQTEKGKEDTQNPATSKNMLKSSEYYPKSSVRGPTQVQYRRQAEKPSKGEISHISQQESVRLPKPNDSRERSHRRPDDEEGRYRLQENDYDDRSRMAYSRTNRIHPKSSRVIEPHQQRSRHRYMSQKEVEEDPYTAYDPRVHRFQQVEHPVGPAPVEPLPTHSKISNSTRKKEPNSTSKRYVPDAHSQYI